MENKNKNINKCKSKTQYPDIDLPAFNPPVPNRAWTELRGATPESELECEKKDLYKGNENLL